MTVSSAALLRQIEDASAFRAKRGRLRAYVLAAFGGAFGWSALYFFLTAIRWLILAF